MGGKVAQLAASRRPEGLSGLILVAPAQPTPRRNPDEMRQGQLHAYDNRENFLRVIGSGLLTAHPPSPEILEQIVEDSMSGSHEATMAYPTESILEDISAEVANINVPTALLAGELDQVDSIDDTRPKSWLTFRTPSSRSSRGAATRFRLMSLCSWRKRLQVLRRGWRDKEELPLLGPTCEVNA
jgi:pimeloyl-ACP methyl ester carboxylesterase